jgi:hypothetical protein
MDFKHSDWSPLVDPRREAPLSGQQPTSWPWLARHRRARVVRAEVQRRGSSASAYGLAMASDPGSVEAVQSVDEYLARAALENELAHLTTATLRSKMRRSRLVMPEETAWWTQSGDGGVLTAYGIVQVSQRLREARRASIAWWCLFLLSIAALGAGAASSF